MDISFWDFGMASKSILHTIKMHRKTKKSKIEFWKGQYGAMHGFSISSGCEIGLYYSSGRRWNCAYQKDRRIRMSMTLYKRGYL